MQIKYEQLNSHLQQALKPVYLISGDETLLVQESCELLRQKAREQGFLMRESHAVDGRFDWQEVLNSANSLSLFSERKLIELRFRNGKFSKSDSDALLQLLDGENPDTLFLITMPRLESASKNSKCYKAIDNAGACLAIWPVERSQLPGWIRGRLSRYKLEATDEAVALLADNVEGNLLAAQQEIDKLYLLSDSSLIDIEAMSQAVSNSSRYTVFNYADRCLQGDGAAAIKTLQGLQAEGGEATVILWAVSRELRTLLSLHYAVDNGIPLAQAMRDERIFSIRQTMVQQAFKRLSKARLGKLLQKARLVDQSIKGQKPDSPWLHLEQLTLGFCGR